LIDLLKSPEVFKAITGSNVEIIRMKEEFQKKEIIEDEKEEEEKD